MCKRRQKKTTHLETDSTKGVKKMSCGQTWNEEVKALIETWSDYHVSQLLVATVKSPDVFVKSVGQN